MVANLFLALLARSFYGNATYIVYSIKWSILQKRVSKFTPKQFYEIDPKELLQLDVECVNN